MTIIDSYQSLARLFDYPEDKQLLLTDSAALDTFMTEQRLECSLAPFALFASAAPLAVLQEEYVACFDFNPATAPYLGHHLFGDNQKKGGYMIALKQEFSRYSYEPPGNELPDHISVVLGFLAHLAKQEEEDARRMILSEAVLPGMERMKAAFAERQESPWKTLVEAAALLSAADCTEVKPC